MGVIYYGLIMFICVQWLLKSTQKVFALCYYLLVIVGNCWTPEMTINVNFIHNLRAGHALGEERKSKGHALWTLFLVRRGRSRGETRGAQAPNFFITENKCVSKKHTIKVCISCSWRCPWLSVVLEEKAQGGSRALEVHHVSSKSPSRVRDGDKGSNNSRQSKVNQFF